MLTAPTFWYSSAREGFLDLLTNGAQRDQQDQGVLLPAYIGWSDREGSGVFDPVRASGRPFDFYALNSDLSTNLRSLESVLDAGSFSHVVLIHYFGRRDPNSDAVYRLARQHGALVVDDLAHGFFSSISATDRFAGDVQLFSLHKQFPLPDGGLIRYPNHDCISSQKSSRNDLAEAVLSYDWTRIAQLRRHNFEVLAQRLSITASYEGPYELLWPVLTGADIPQSFPIRLNGNFRDKLYFELNQRGFGATSLYHTLIPESSGRFPLIDEISRTIINLPLHQDCTDSQLEEMADLFIELVDLEISRG